MDGLCEYEKIRLRNTRQREALLAEFELKQAWGSSGVDAPGASCKRAPRREKVEKEGKDPTEPVRKSLRLGSSLPPVNSMSTTKSSLTISSLFSPPQTSVIHASPILSSELLSTALAPLPLSPRSTAPPSPLQSGFHPGSPNSLGIGPPLPSGDSSSATDRVSFATDLSQVSQLLDFEPHLNCEVSTQTEQFSCLHCDFQTIDNFHLQRHHMSVHVARRQG